MIEATHPAYITPTTDDLIAVIAFLEQRLAIAQNRSVRDEFVLTFADMQHGRSMGPQAQFIDPDHLRIRMDF